MSDEATPAATEEKMPNVVTAFTVVVDASGRPNVTPALLPDDLIPARDPGMLDIRRAVLEIAADLAAQASAQYVTEVLSEQQGANSVGGGVGAAAEAAEQPKE